MSFLRRFKRQNQRRADKHMSMEDLEAFLSGITGDDLPDADLSELPEDVQQQLRDMQKALGPGSRIVKKPNGNISVTAGVAGIFGMGEGEALASELKQDLLDRAARHI